MRQSISLVAALALTLGAGSAHAADKPIVGLITKTNTNPFFVKMKAGAEEAAKSNDVELRSFAGKVDGDNESQVAAIENLIAAGAKGILITPNDSAPSCRPWRRRALRASWSLLSIPRSIPRMLRTQPLPPTISWPAR